jgi:hypothetical protein
LVNWWRPNRWGIELAGNLWNWRRWRAGCRYRRVGIVSREMSFFNNPIRMRLPFLTVNTIALHGDPTKKPHCHRPRSDLLTALQNQPNIGAVHIVDLTQPVGWGGAQRYPSRRRVTMLAWPHDRVSSQLHCRGAASSSNGRGRFSKVMGFARAQPILV